MIFVILGTQDKSFIRLLKEIENLKKKEIIKEEVIVQAGYTKFESKYMKVFDYISMSEFEEYITKADLIITHGGAGSILSSLKKNKKVIAVPRLSQYGEHTNDHQTQIVNMLSKEGYILSCNAVKNLGSVIKESKSFKPRKYIPNNKKMLDIIENYVTKTDNNNHSLVIIFTVLFIIFLILFLIIKI